MLGCLCRSLALHFEAPKGTEGQQQRPAARDPVEFLLGLSSSSSSSSRSSSSRDGGTADNTEAPAADTAAAAVAAAAESPAAAAAGQTPGEVRGNLHAFSSIDYETYFGPGIRYEPINDGFLVFPPIYPDRVFLLQARDMLTHQQHQQQQQQQREREQEEQQIYDPPWVRATPDAAATKAAAKAAAAAAAGDYGAPHFELGGPHGAPTAPGLVPNRRPSYLNPENPFLRTGRQKDRERRAETGQLQRKQWGMDEVEGDIPRGPLGAPNDRFKELVDSVDWTREHPTLHDRNHYKRSFFETGLADTDRSEDCYFDPQFLGAPDAFSYAANGGPCFNWSLRWVPWLCKKYPRGGPPIKSQCFALGGVDPLQLWLYPDGLPESLPGFCALKIVSRPGWHLPFPIKLWVRGAPALPLFEQQQQQQQQEGAARAKGRQGRRQQTRAAVGALAELAQPSVVSVGPVWREAAECVAYCKSFCRLLDKGSYSVSASGAPLPPSRTPQSPEAPIVFNPETDVVLDAFGGLQVGVSVADEAWDWDDGAWDFEQWLKRQSAFPDDNELEQTLPPDFTHSPNFENFKYDEVPDKHFARYLPSALPPAVSGELLEAALLQPASSY